MNPSNRRFDADTVRAIRSAPGSQHELAHRFGASQTTISFIKTRQSYRWVGDTPDEDVDPGRPTKLSEADVIAIRNSDDSATSLAKRFGVAQPTISQIRLGKIWKRVGGPIRPPAHQRHRRIMPRETREQLRSDLLEISRLYGAKLHTVAYHAKQLAKAAAA
jgi:hypothetical protein